MHFKRAVLIREIFRRAVQRRVLEVFGIRERERFVRRGLLATFALAGSGGDRIKRIRFEIVRERVVLQCEIGDAREGFLRVRFPDMDFLAGEATRDAELDTLRGAGVDGFQYNAPIARVRRF
jgi:hypothetical protein